MSNVAAASRLRAAGATDPGRLRSSNEDRMHLDAERGLFLVADGVGGHAAGEVAATIARDTIVDALAVPGGDAASRLRRAVTLANNEIMRHATASPELAGMTCVVTAALVEQERLTIAHVGDSRLYLLSPSGMAKLTHDHSPVGEREDAREISEAEAMSHPRRNEVFRDVGSAIHEPDDHDFIEVVETTFAADDALLICSDGLSDMLTSAAIERTIRAHAGDPAAATRALVDAANQAGGRDNVTVVYVEGERFGGGATSAGTTEASPGKLRRVLASRVLWSTAGVLAGLALGFGLVLAYDVDLTTGGRRLVVGGNGADGYATIAAAIQAARPRDVIHLEPGEYRESVVLPAGVDLVAAKPGTVTLVPPGGDPDRIGIKAEGSLGNRIAGIRVHGEPGAPVAVGLRLAGHELEVDDVQVDGEVGVGMEIVNDGSVLIRSSRFAVDGLPIKVGPLAAPVIRQNLFTRGAAQAALDVAADAAPELLDNVFVNYAGAELIQGSGPSGTPAGHRELLHHNYVIRSHGR